MWIFLSPIISSRKSGTTTTTEKKNPQKKALKTEKTLGTDILLMYFHIAAPIWENEKGKN